MMARKLTLNDLFRCAYFDGTVGLIVSGRDDKQGVIAAGTIYWLPEDEDELIRHAESRGQPQ